MEYIKNITLGSDVEFFVADEKGSIASAEGIVPGTKREPFKFKSAIFPGLDGFATQLDNVLAEGNIPPAISTEAFVSYMEELRAHLSGVVAKKKLKLVAQADAKVPEKYLQTENAKAFGCDSSFNCWTLAEEPVTPTQPTLRTAGFHIHVGYTNPSRELNIAIARAFDVSLGLGAVVFEPKNERKALGYGKAGNFRHQPHGVEYRVLSSWWAQDKAHIRWAAQYAVQTLRALNGHDGQSITSIMREMTKMAVPIQDAINTQNIAQASELRREAAAHGLAIASYGIGTY